MIVRNASPSFIEYYALQGSYGRVTYYVTKTGLRDVAENLSLAPQDELTFAERIQRLVNERRVQKELLPYLESNSLRFFNSLVCVLLPDKNNSPNGCWEFEEFQDEKGNKLGGLGKLRILKDVGRVVLDGQHRFAALKALWQKHSASEESSTEDIEVSLVFVMVDALGRMGTPAPNLRAETIQAVRNIFAVLNRTAKPVDKTTLLLIDDSDFLNLATRRLIEQGLIDESLVKWVGGENLKQNDPFLTTLHVVKDALAFCLRDKLDEIEEGFTEEADKETFFGKYYDALQGSPLPTKIIVSRVITGLSFSKTWQTALTKKGISVSRQPGSTTLDREQAKYVADMREARLETTVAGQKALFRAVIDAYAGAGYGDDAALDRVIRRADGLLAAGKYRRDREPNNPFAGVLFDSGGRMVWAENAVDLARRMLSVALGLEGVKKGVRADYCAYTGREPEVITSYWDDCANIPAV